MSGRSDQIGINQHNRTYRKFIYRIKTILVFPLTVEQVVQTTGRTALIFFKGLQKGKPQTKHSEDKLKS